MLTGQILWTGPNRRQNETFTEGASVSRRNCRQDTEWETEHLRGFKQQPHDQHRFVTQHNGLASDFATKVDLNGVDSTTKQFCWEIYRTKSIRSSHKLNPVLYIKRFTPLVGVRKWLNCRRHNFYFEVYPFVVSCFQICHFSYHWQHQTARGFSFSHLAASTQQTQCNVTVVFL